MKSLLKGFLTLTVAVLLLPQVAAASGILTINFNHTSQSVLQGGSLTFSGTLTVTGAPDIVYVAADSIAPSPGFGIVGFDTPTPYLIMLDDFSFLGSFLSSPSFPTYPFQMSSDGLNGPSSFTLDFFTVTIGSLVTPGTYLGAFDIYGGDTDADFFVISSAPFQIDVASPPLPPVDVPEPGSLVLLCTGLAAVGLRFRATRLIPKKRVA